MMPQPPAATVPDCDSNSNIANRTPIARGFDATYERIVSRVIGSSRRGCAYRPHGEGATLSHATYPLTGGC